MPERGSGTLFVVGTPIGNLQDLSPRAKDVLRQVELIAAEDTRRTRRLLSSIEVSKPLISYHAHNEAKRKPELLAKLARGQSIALVSDAGMPLVSDPGWLLVRAARDAHVQVSVVPGPSAVTAALAVCGVATDRFTFEGFLPRRPGPRAERLRGLGAETRTMVFYESVHRLDGTLQALQRQFGAGRPAALARELTKLHEAVYGVTLGDLTSQLADGRIPAKGEFVVVVAGSESKATTESEAERVFAVLVEAMPANRAVALTSKLTGVPRNAVYRLTRVPQT